MRVRRFALVEVLDRWMGPEHRYFTREHDEDVQVALREAFAAARRKLEDYVRGQRGDLKRHPPKYTGRVQRIDAEEGFGFTRICSKGRHS